MKADFIRGGVPFDVVEVFDVLPSRQSCCSAADNPEGGSPYLTLDFGFFDDLDLNAVFAFFGFDRSGKCASHFGGRVGARTATEYSQIMFLSSGGSLNNRDSLHHVSEKEGEGQRGKSIALDHSHLGAPEIQP
jgi:hypothetical protein